MERKMRGEEYLRLSMKALVVGACGGCVYTAARSPGRFHAEVQPTLNLDGTWICDTKGVVNVDKAVGSLEGRLKNSDIHTEIEVSGRHLRMTGSFGGMDVDVFDGTFQKPVLVNGEARFDVMDRKGRKMTLRYKKGRIGTTGDDGIVNWFEYQR